MITLNELAKILGLSEATVSNALTGKGRMKAATREKVYAAALQYGYKFKDRKTSINRVIVVAEDRNSLNTNPITAGIDFVSKTNSVFWQVINLDIFTRGMQRAPGVETLRALIGDMLGQLAFKPSGMIYISNYPRKAPGLFDGLGFPVVAIKMRSSGESAYIDQDEQQGAYAAVEYLYTIGRRNIVVLSGEITTYSSSERMIGYQRALIDHSLSYHPKYIWIGDWEPESGYKMCKNLMAQHNPPDAIFSMNDGMAKGVYKALRELGLSIPGDVSVIGFDNTVECQMMEPELTSVKPPLWQIGASAAQKMLLLLKGIQADNSLIPCEIVKRQSC